MSPSRPVFLFGPPGVGKTTLGTAACAPVGLRFAEACASGDLSAVDADVVAVPWPLSGDRSLWRTVRTRGTAIGLWAHPLDLLTRSDPPYRCVPSRPLKTHGGYGRTGDATREYRLLDRQCDYVLRLDGVALPACIEAVTDAIREAREPADPLAEMRASLESWSRDCIEDYGVQPAAVHVALDAMAAWLVHLAASGTSPRVLSGIRSDLQAALQLVSMYDRPTAAKMLGELSYPPHDYEFRRKFTDSPALVQRYRRTLEGFAEFLQCRDVPAVDGRQG